VLPSYPNGSRNAPAPQSHSLKWFDNDKIHTQTHNKIPFQTVYLQRE